MSPPESPSSRIIQARIGANPGPTLPAVHERATREVYAACGVPADLFERTDGTAAREGFRRFLHATVQPMAKVFEHELSTKLEADGAADVRWSVRCGPVRPGSSLPKHGRGRDGRVEGRGARRAHGRRWRLTDTSWSGTARRTHPAGACSWRPSTRRGSTPREMARHERMRPVAEAVAPRQPDRLRSIGISEAD